MSRSTSPPEKLNGFDVIPSDLANRDRWVCWKQIDRDGKPRKVPVDPTTHDFASATDAETWGTFTEARECHKAGTVNTAGVGFVFSPEDTVCGIDLDDARDPETGEPEPWARDIIQMLDSFTEISPSGTGYHVYVHGVVPDGGNRKDDIEIYDRDRFFTVTGDHVDSTPHTVNQRNGSLAEVHGKYVADDDTDADMKPVREDINLSDQQLLAKARDADNGDKFDRLYNGDTSGYPSHSEADMALTSLLTFWTGGDQEQIDRLFRDSGLYREKWNEQRGSDTYAEITISEALKRRTEFYNPEQGRSTPTDRPNSPQSDGNALALDASAVKAWANLGEEESISDLTDREKAAVVADLVDKHDDLHVRVRRDNRTLWSYDGGIWKDEGERTLEHAARKALGSMNYGQNVSQELKAQARAREEWEVEPETFGLEPGLIAVENGVVYLEAAAGGGGDAALRELEPEDYALARLPVEYDPNAGYEEWEQYVREWAEEGKADALQEYVGYCLHIGAIPIDRALLLVGSGANGKSTFLHVVRSLLGEENTTSVGLQTLANEKDAVADFYGSVANIDDDLSTRKLGNGLGMFKKLTAGDRVRGRRLYQDGFEYEATGKHLYAANQVPQVEVSDDDDAFWRRWLLVEFPNHYPPSDRDSGLRDRLTRAETLSGVLNWAIDGWARLLEQGHFTDEHEHAFEKRKRWQRWGDSVDEFISEHVERDPDADRITTADAHRRYKAWCVATGKESVGQTHFTNSLKRENVGYRRSLRVPKDGGPPARGYDALGFSEDVPTVSTEEETDDGDDDDDPAQQSLV